MGVYINGMKMPKECGECRWFHFHGETCTTPKYYLDARCELVKSGQDWYGKDSRGGWIGESIEHIPGWAGYYPYRHCVEMGTRASQCPLCELPSAQPEPQWILCSERLPKREKEKYWVCTDTGYQCECRWTNDVYGLGTNDDWSWKIFDIPQYSKVVAWMPLPEPYREDGRE